MKVSEELLLQNGMYAGIALLLVILGIVLLTSLFLRLVHLLLLSRIWRSSAATKDAVGRTVWRWAFGFMFFMLVLLIGGLLLVTHLKMRLGDLVHSVFLRLQTKDWIGLGLVVLKTLGVLLLGFLAARLLVMLLAYVQERLHSSEVLTGHRERLGELLDRLRRALSTTLLFGTLLLCTQILGLPEGGQRILGFVSYVCIAIYIAHFAVGTAHLAIDVFFDLSEVLREQENPLRYLSRFRHLSPLTKRTADYFIYVGAATCTIEQIIPGTWEAQLGRLALRVIAIFYLSRVLIEVCVLFTNEFFLSRAEQNPAEQQKRQTLLPIATGLLRYGIYFSAIVMILREAGIDPTPLLAGAGVAGVAIGLGAQAFVGDIVAGFFILFENLFLVGDFIQVGEVKGKVEEIGVRVTKIRDEAGLLHAIPNGEVRKVSSHSKGYVNVVIDIPVPYDENLHQIFAVLRQKMGEVRASQPDILEATDFSLEDLRESAVLLRTITMVKPGMADELSAVLRLAFWDALLAAQIGAPYARRMLLSPSQLASKTAPFTPKPSDAVYRTDIQKIKAYHLYLALDVDDNGYLEQADLEALGRRLIENQKREPNSPIHVELRTELGAYWKALQEFVDRNQDGRISKEEYIQFCASLAADLKGPAGVTVQSLSNVLFMVCDRNHTGTLSEHEFVQFARAYGLSDAAAVAGFKLIDHDRNGSITKEEWLRFMRDVFLSRKLNDAAAVVFGPGCRENGTDFAKQRIL